MGTRVPRRASNEDATFQKLAKDLRLETSPLTIFNCLKALKEGLSDPHTAGHRARIFLRAGGLPPLIRHLMGSITTSQTQDSRIDPSDISDEAARALSQLLGPEETSPELRVSKGLVPPLLDALRAAPAMTARTSAAYALAQLADDQPGERRAMVEGGVLELVTALYDDRGEMAWLTNLEQYAGMLVCALVCSKTVRPRQLERAIRTAKAVGTFSVLVLLQDCLIDQAEKLVGTVLDAGVVRALVDTLEDESPFCVAAAAGDLGFIARTSGGRGQTLFAASGAVPALLRVIEKRLPIGDGKLYPLAIYKWLLPDQKEVLHFDDPTAVAISSLFSVPDSNAMLDSFLEAGGIPVVVKLLRETTCPTTLAHAVDLLVRMVSTHGRPNTPDRCQELADQLHDAGVWEAALHVAGKRGKRACGRVLTLLFEVFLFLSPHHAAAAKAALLAGNILAIAIDHMANGEVNMDQNGVRLLMHLSQDPQIRERMCAQRFVDPLTKGLSRYLPKATGDMLLVTSMLLRNLFESAPDDFIPAAAKADVSRGLVCLMRKLQKPRAGPAFEVKVVLHAALSCLMDLLVLDMDNTVGPRKAAVEAGTVPLFIDLLTGRDEATICLVLRLVFPLLIPADPGEVRRWGDGLLRAVSQLLIATPPIAPERAADTLFQIGAMHRALIRDYRSWGIDAAVRRLKRHSDPEIANTARQLLFLVNEGLHLSEADLINGMQDAGLEPPDFLIVEEEPDVPIHPPSTPDANRQSTGPGPDRQRGRKPGAARSSDPTTEARGAPKLSEENPVNRTAAASLEAPKESVAEEPGSNPRVSSNPNQGAESTRTGTNRQTGPNPSAATSLDATTAGPGGPQVTRGPAHAAPDGDQPTGAARPTPNGDQPMVPPGSAPHGRQLSGAARATPNGDQPPGAAHASPNGDQPSGVTGPSLPAEGGTRGSSSRRRRREPRVQICACCCKTAEATQGGKLQSCTACRRVLYCGRECQKADWPAHKEKCRRLQAAQA